MSAQLQFTQLSITPRQRQTVNVFRESSDAMAAILNLHFPQGTIVDVNFGHGVFYKRLARKVTVMWYVKEMEAQTNEAKRAEAAIYLFVETVHMLESNGWKRDESGSNPWYWWRNSAVKVSVITSYHWA